MRVRADTECHRKRHQTKRPRHAPTPLSRYGGPGIRTLKSFRTPVFKFDATPSAGLSLTPICCAGADQARAESPPRFASLRPFVPKPSPQTFPARTCRGGARSTHRRTPRARMRQLPGAEAGPCCTCATSGAGREHPSGCSQAGWLWERGDVPTGAARSTRRERVPWGGRNDGGMFRWRRVAVVYGIGSALDTSPMAGNIVWRKYRTMSAGCKAQSCTSWSVTALLVSWHRMQQAPGIQKDSGACHVRPRLDQASIPSCFRRLRHATPAMPARPVPRSIQVPGSGVA